MLLFALAAAVTVNVSLLAQVSGVGLPLLVALVTKQRAPSWLKAGLLAFLAAVAGLIASAIHNNGTIIIHQALTLGLTAWVTGIASYYGFHKPTGLADAVAGATPDLGVGSNPQPPVETEPEAPPAARSPRARAVTKRQAPRRT